MDFSAPLAILTLLPPTSVPNTKSRLWYKLPTPVMTTLEVSTAAVYIICHE